MHRDQARNSAAFDEHLAHPMSRPFRRHHRHIHFCRRLDRPKANVEPMPEHDRLALLHVRRDLLRVRLALRVIRRQDHDHVSPRCRIAHARHLQAGLLRLLHGLARRRQSHPHLHARILQIQRVRMPLRPIANHSHLLLLDQRQIRVLIVIRLRHYVSSF